MYNNEKVFKGEKDVKYVFKKSFKKTEGLIILFSGFQPVNKPPTYNYGRTLEEFDCNQLFILDDFGARASYYLCENRDFSIERSIISLINKIIKENEIKVVITAGSSKGGYAALYYGIKYGFDYIISASPQYFVGDYLLKQTRTNDVVKFMSGDDGEKDHQFLNNIMRDLIHNTKHKPNIFIHLGKGEVHYHKHVKPMIADFKKAGLRYSLDLGNYDRHNDVGKFFPSILKKKIRDYLNYPSLNIKLECLENKARYTAITDDKDKVAWYVYKNNKRVEMKKYSLNKFIDLEIDGRSSYKVKIFVENKKGNRISRFSHEIKA